MSSARKADLSWRLGAMIEVPRAALMAGTLAGEAAFFSFGSNDLTQTTLGMGRDDAARFMGRYVDRGIYGADPFITLDEAGVGALIALAREQGGRPAPTSNWACAVSMALTRPRSPSVWRRGSITFRPRPIACRWRVWRRLRRRCEPVRRASRPKR
jgi:hypothetical protein